MRTVWSVMSGRGSPGRRRRWQLLLIPAVGAAVLCQLGLASAVAASAATTTATTKAPAPARTWTKPTTGGGMDCNGMSPAYKTIKLANACTDIRGMYGVNNSNTWDGRFYDNGRYIGHDEPDTRYLSSVPGSGNNVTWHETLGVDPAAAPTVKSPGKDVNHYAELTIAPWFSMALCNPFSYPLLPCKPNSDVNQPATVKAPVPAGVYPGGGSSFLEMQFYPPGMAPFADNISCDNTHWCASLHINDLECTLNFASCNTNCEETTNFAFIQTNGVPTGPPSPQLSDLATSTPNGNTLLMNPGDKLTIHISDAPVPGHPGQKALVTSIKDNTTGQSGFMQASAANGFMATNINNCSGTPWNYEPEYSTSSVRSITPWAALQVDVSTEFEIGHFEACTGLAQRIVLNLAPGVTDTTYNQCSGPYEASATAPESLEPGDAVCYFAGDTHGSLNAPPNIVTGCEDTLFQNGDLDFDGNPYWPDWPTSTTSNLYPSTFQQLAPTTVRGLGYPRFQIQTDAALSESSCAYPNTSGCKVPPPTAPGKFYPYWTLTKACVLEFGNMRNGNTFGRFAQYGTVPPGLGYPELFGPIMSNPCRF
jgi:hypothetical protein